MYLDNLSVWKDFRSKGIISIVISIFVWIAVGIGTWLILKSYIPSYYYSYHYTSEIINGIILKITLILSAIQLLLMIWPMCEYLFKFHYLTNMMDSYKWYLPFAIMTAVSLIVILITNKIFGVVGWITLLQIVGIMVVICVPRFLLPPN